MIKLVQIELEKILKRKSIYIIWGLMLIFCLLNNILYYTDYDNEGNYKYLEQEDIKQEQNELKNEIKKYNQNNPNEISIYVTLKTKLDILNLKQNFSQNSWQYKKINTYLYDIIYQINYYECIEQKSNQLEILKEDYKKLLSNFTNNNYSYFLKMEINKNIDIQQTLKEKYNKIEDEKNKQEIQTQIENNKFKLKILNYRLKNNLIEDNSYLNITLENYQINYEKVEYYKKIGNKKTYQEKIDYQNSLSELKISEYILKNQKNINKQNNLNNQLRTIVEDYEIFIIILILIVCSTIICDEFKTGTIKLLLIKPYSRGKILLSKYFCSIIVIAVSILILIIMQIVIGGIIFSVDSLNIPVVIYNFNRESIIEYSIWQYMIIRIIAMLPFFLMIITISFFLAVMSNSTIISITIPLMLYMFTPTITTIASKYQLNFMKYLVNINWNIKDYLFGKLPQVQFINFKFSMILLLIYFIILLILTFIIFKKRNIKNI